MKTIEQSKTDLAAATKDKADAALVAAEKQKAEAEKKRMDAEAGFITYLIHVPMIIPSLLPMVQ